MASELLWKPPLTIALALRRDCCKWGWLANPEGHETLSGASVIFLGLCAFLGLGAAKRAPVFKPDTRGIPSNMEHCCKTGMTESSLESAS